MIAADVSKKVALDMAGEKRSCALLEPIQSFAPEVVHAGDDVNRYVIAELRAVLLKKFRVAVLVPIPSDE